MVINGTHFPKFQTVSVARPQNSKIDKIHKISDGNETLQERFKKIDANMVTEKLKTEQKSHGKIITFQAVSDKIISDLDKGIFK
jgi:hypothetical protein